MVKSELTKRQKFILQIIDSLEKASNQKILEKVSANFDKASRVTVVRDLNALLKNKAIRKTGMGRAVSYVSNIPLVNRDFDAYVYFLRNPDEREIKKEKLDFTNKSLFNDVLNASEEKEIRDLTENFKKRFASYSASQIKKELERITIEFSWKSSRIEGNTYTLLDTERLIRDHEEAKGKTHEETVMILNHKKALEYVWKYPKDFQQISVRKIENLHTLVSSDLTIAKGLRKRGVGIIGTAYKPFDNIFQIKESLESLCESVNSIENPFVKALVTTAGVSYIQPFEDGNKRTARLIGNALLISNGYCPLSYRSADEVEYKKAIILFYEQHSLVMFKKMFAEQYKFAVGNYFL